jgi:hypothetical protein
MLEKEVLLSPMKATEKNASSATQLMFAESKNKVDAEEDSTS